MLKTVGVIVGVVPAALSQGDGLAATWQTNPHLPGDEASFTVHSKDDPITAFVGPAPKPNDFIFYAGGEGRWQVGLLASPDDRSKWNRNKDFSAQEYFGTFNGLVRYSDGHTQEWSVAAEANCHVLIEATRQPNSD